MDLLSLPEEMLVSVFKYANIPKLAKWRQISSQIDAISIRNRLNEPQLKTLTFNFREDVIQVIIETFDNVECIQHFRFNEENRDKTLYALVQNMYLKVRYIQILEINNILVERINMPNSLLEMFIESSKKRRISGIRLLYFHLDMDFTLIRQLLTSFNIKDFGLPLCKTPNLVQVNSLFDDLSLEYLIFAVAGLTLRDIKMVCKTNVPKRLWVRCKDVTLKEAVKFLADIFDRRGNRLDLSLYGIRSEGPHEDAVKDIIKPLDTYGDVEVSEKWIRIINFTNNVRISFHL